jgi:hypothetical protein
MNYYTTYYKKYNQESKNQKQPGPAATLPEGKLQQWYCRQKQKKQDKIRPKTG